MNFLKQSFKNRDTSSEGKKTLRPLPRAKRPDPKPLGSKIFISYRRSDTRHIAGRLFDHLIAEFSELELFLDVDTIPAGVDFKKHISSALHETAVLLVLIGDHWINPVWRSYRRWLGLSKAHHDFVLSEIELALDLGVPIIPLLVDNVPMPNSNDVPASIYEFTSRNGIPVRSGTDFRKDMIKVLEQVKQLRDEGMRRKSN
jgi:TIR domain